MFNSQNSQKGNKKVLGIIPARLGSTRVPEKMLTDIVGKTLIEWTILRTLKAKSIDKLIVATDSEKIAEKARNLDVEVVMTPSELPTGTDRVAEALERFNEFKPDIVVNIWGDEPLFPAEAIDECVELLIKNEDLQVCGVGDLITDEKMKAEPSIVKVLTDEKNDVISFFRDLSEEKNTEKDLYQIVGAMAMERDFLNTFLNSPQTEGEIRDSIEQRRIIESGHRMKIIKGNFGNLGVNTPEELEKVRKFMQDAMKEKKGKVNE